MEYFNPGSIKYKALRSVLFEKNENQIELSTLLQENLNKKYSSMKKNILCQKEAEQYCKGSSKFETLRNWISQYLTAMKKEMVEGQPADLKCWATIDNTGTLDDTENTGQYRNTGRLEHWEH
ncbi:hypothetical protein Glove_19g89 [Diversispora epigaea]|uniref:Uncharacterized protein n=1 Tax=Diversispora epigaea TaxID=1348612 RepID=A0A397JV38_9GLOM|nr:hypothetical protein Glove_19g89 [Diversispora epigaea]